jgi:lipopolysaccharide heptosyltransferase II
MTAAMALGVGARRLLHAARGILSTCTALACDVYGAWSWLAGPRARLPLDPSAIRRILVIRVDLLGDLVFSFPTINALSSAYPQARIDLLVLPYTSEVLSGVRSVGKVHRLDVNRYRRPRGLAELGTLVALIRNLRRQRYDLAVSLSGLVGGPLAIASGARVRAGHSGDTYRGCFNVSVAGRRYDRAIHEVDYELDLVRGLGVPAPASRPEIGSFPRLTEFAQDPNRAANPATTLPHGPYAVIVPGASNGGAKRWPAAYWSALADRIAREQHLGIVLVGAGSERTLAEAVTRGTTVPISNLAGTTSVRELVDLLAGAAIVLAGDTGPLHVAAALGRPVVGVYGPTDPTNTGPLASRSSVVRLGLACSPCYDLRTPADCKLPDRSVACMWGLGPERVYAEACRVLDAPEGSEDSAGSHGALSGVAAASSGGAAPEFSRDG